MASDERDVAADGQISSEAVPRDETMAELDAAWADEIQRRVEEIRNGDVTPELAEVIAELARLEAELEGDIDGEDAEDDPVEVAASWADEIAARIAEIDDGTVKTYAAEDVMAALRVRFG
jgi:hypothetical protein